MKFVAKKYIGNIMFDNFFLDNIVFVKSIM